MLKHKSYMYVYSYRHFEGACLVGHKFAGVFVFGGCASVLVVSGCCLWLWDFGLVSIFYVFYVYACVGWFVA